MSNRALRFFKGSLLSARVVQFFVVMFVAMICLLVAFSYSLTHQEINRERDAELSACLRLNIVRAADNRSHEIDYEFFNYVIELVHADRASATFVRRIRVLAAGKQWIPLTRCARAVDHPDTYVPPVPISFRTRMPPASAVAVPRVSGRDLFR